MRFACAILLTSVPFLFGCGDRDAANIDLGENATKSLDYDLAISYFSEALRKYPRDAPTRYKRMELLRLRGRYNDAANDGEILIKQDPGSAALYHLARARCCQNEHSSVSLWKAIRDCSDAIRIDPKYYEAIVLRGECYLDLSRYDEATSDLSRAETICPEWIRQDERIRVGDELVSARGASKRKAIK